MPQLPILPLGNTTSDEALEWVKSHLSTCENCHGSCNDASPGAQTSFLPTRLIDIAAFGASGAGDVVLRDTSDIIDASSVRYIALSYCWGGLVPESQTTHQTLQEGKTRIPCDTLPRTFQDAADFASRLGIRYLWIDSICIIQGDQGDWLRESARMYHVYGNAYLTLAASHAYDANGGLYSRGPPSRRILIGTEFEVWARPAYRHVLKTPNYLWSSTRSAASRSQREPGLTRIGLFLQGLSTSPTPNWLGNATRPLTASVAGFENVLTTRSKLPSSASS